MICANESQASGLFWRGYDRDTILDEIVRNSELNYALGRQSSGYVYRIETPKKDRFSLKVAADKIWNPALLLLAGQHDLLSTLSARLECRVALVNCVRNPFDVLATMNRRSSASLENRLRWYRMHCEATQMLIDRDEYPILTIRHEELVAHPNRAAASLFQWLGSSADESVLNAMERVIFRDVRKSRMDVIWPTETVDRVMALIDDFPFLHGYNYST